ncbi:MULTISPECIES: ABC transporter permease [unclassified Mycolicibacterium]|uniref:ABC transporter permease n=2 Tax=Mycolicibacterium TaxID=1866885 RepID=UPI0012DBF2BE|nr:MULTISPECIES: ABC transporter permease [unclassified Mycolicibacterium]MUL82233.1 ABC transporter permease [Mycolicibacterium sp. CBMA 329]MUL87999.1 ABC transporter permease [Mycolicibacterium sp. CBMA 331]MUM38296.1 ABC transporter permease [Mycolicibacterium sp. CBMA 247]MUM44064.1 ABC transporter permease [Mycolicibacterium sp. CBMA 294]
MAAIVAAAVREEVDVTRKRPNVPHRSRVLYLGFGLLGVLALFAIMAPLFGSPYVMHKDGLTDLGAPLGMFSPNHVFGTDSLGRDMLARSAAGLRATLIVAIVANVTSVLLGTVVGLLAGFFGSFVEQSLMRIVDVFLSIPIVLSGLALASIVGRGMWGIVVVVTALYWAWTARLVYGEVLRLRGRGFVEAATVHGVGRLTVLRRHVLPHTSTVLINIAALNGAAVVVIGAGLSYLGAGIQPPQPELGNLLQSGSAAIDFAPHLLLVPLTLTIATVLSIVLIAEGVNRRNSLSERRSWLDI